MRILALGLLLALLLFPHVASAERADALKVVVLNGPLDWIEARRSVEAELEATGFEVLPWPSNAETPGQLIDELRLVASERGDVRGSVAVFQESAEDPHGRAYVWIPERDNLFQVDVPANAGPIASEVLSLRVVELLRVRLLGEPPTPSPSPAASPPEPERPLSLWLAAGPLLSPALDSPLIQAGVGVSFTPVERLAFDASAFLGLFAGRTDTEAGQLDVSVSQIQAHALFTHTLTGQHELAVGPGAGILLFRGRGEGNQLFAGTRANEVLGYVSLRGRAVLSLGDLALLLLIEPGVTLPALSIHADATPVMRFGQPLILVAGGIAWSP